jgi:hypothetical protein
VSAALALAALLAAAPAEPAKLTLLFTGDCGGEVAPCG